MMKIARLALISALQVSARRFAASPTPAEPADKSGSDLFHPVPDDLLHDLATDRPDKTNSPHTLDAGHLQVESGLVASIGGTVGFRS